MLNFKNPLPAGLTKELAYLAAVYIGVLVPLSYSQAIAQSADSSSETSTSEMSNRDNFEEEEQQQNDTAQADRQETIVVSGTGIPRSIDQWVNPVKVLERSDIIRRLKTTLGDTLADEPGVSTTFFGTGASRPIVRGLGAERVLVLSNGLGTIDVSVTSPDHQVLADGIDAERIEVLRGPAALAYGGQAIGGGVNVLDSLIAREKPARNWAGEAFTAFSSVSDGNDSGIVVKGTQDDQQFVYSFSASIRDHNDYSIPGSAESEYLHEEEEDDHEDSGKAENTYVSTKSFAGGLSWVVDRGFVGFGLRDYSTKYGLPGHGHHEEEEEDDHDEENPLVDLEQTKFEMHGEWTFDRMYFSKISGSASFADYKHIEFEAPGEAGTTFQNEGFEASFRTGHNLDFPLVTGLNFSKKTIAATGEEAFLSSTDTSLFGLFAHAASSKSIGLGWEAGLRIENSSFDNVNKGSKDFSLVSSSGGVTWRDETGLVLGAQLSLSERSPNESELFARGPHLATRQYEVGNKELSKEKGLSLEGSVRLTRDRISMGLNAYAYNFDNFIYLSPGEIEHNNQTVTTIDDLRVHKYEQNGAEFRGGEIFVIWDASERGLFEAAWQIRLDIDFVNAQLDDGTDVPLVPPMSALLQVSSESELWKLESSLKIVSEKDAITARQFKTDGYSELGLYGELALSALGNDFREGARGFIDIRNVSDEEIRYSTSVLKDYIPAPGINYRVGIRWNF